MNDDMKFFVDDCCRLRCRLRGRVEAVKVFIQYKNHSEDPLNSGEGGAAREEHVVVRVCACLDDVATCSAHVVICAFKLTRIK